MDLVLTGKSFNIKDMGVEERNLLKAQLYEQDIIDIRNNLSKIENKQSKTDAELIIIKEESEKTKGELDTLKKNTNVMCSPFHSRRKKIFKNLCKKRVRKLCEDNRSSCKYIILSPYFFQNIYSDIAKHFDLDNWQDLNMENYDKLNSDYTRAKNMAENWIPNDWSLKKWIGELIEKRDNGFLKPERCRALSEYLKETNNGEYNPFVI